jgi:Ser-tRNA(Ala) deacylase AlaX
MVLLAKYWKEAILMAVILVMATAFGIDEIGDNHKIKELGESVQYYSDGWDQCSDEWRQLVTSVELQNAQITSLNTEIEKRQQALEEALARPPKVLYRDRIVEVPGIATEPCEKVFEDIALYMKGLVE